MKPTLTHIALGVQSLERTIAFYEKHVRLRVAHERDDGTRVVWLAEREHDFDFVLVLFEIAEAFAFAEAAPFPRPDELHEHVFAA